MIDNFEALAALADHGTMARAAYAIHITQSAVSKRIANLESIIGKKLIEPRGRRVELTPTALRLLERSRPLLAELKELCFEEHAEATGRIMIDVSVSVLISWGAEALADVRDRCPELDLVVNSYHASVSCERVRSGESMVALVQGESSIAPDLIALPVMAQTMVLIPSGLNRFAFPKGGAVLPILAMETKAEAWHYMNRDFKANQASWGFVVKPERYLQSFSAIAQMARAGFGHGVVPRGVARTLGIPDRKAIKFPHPGVKVPVSLIGRRSTLSRPVVQKFYKALCTYPQSANE